MVVNNDKSLMSIYLRNKELEKEKKISKTQEEQEQQKILLPKEKENTIQNLQIPAGNGAFPLTSGAKLDSEAEKELLKLYSKLAQVEKEISLCLSQLRSARGEQAKILDVKLGRLSGEAMTLNAEIQSILEKLLLSGA